MIDFLRRFKLSYSLYNFFHKKELFYNEILLKKYGLRKKYYSSVSSKDFVGVNVIPDIESKPYSVNDSAFYKALTEESKRSISAFEENGYCIIKNYLSIEQVNDVNSEIDTLLKRKKIKFGYGGKIMFAIHSSALLLKIATHKNLLELLSTLLKGKAVVFQSINFMMGSEQDTHSDSIHMTTFPLGGLLGAWIALEDIDEDNGPLHYYPGSHKLPYYLNGDYDNEGNALMIGNKSYSAYEKMIERKIEEQGLKKKIFNAKKGDLLVWHANLFHGGEAHLNKSKTRKSMVFHYFKENAICYHEITQRPALIKKSHPH
jgi:phytanoyl-CoA hydroxylase